MKKILSIAAAALLMSSAAMAQHCCEKGPKLKSYSFVEVQGGMEWTATDAKIDKLLSPIGALSLGHYFTPVVGARLHVSGLEAKGRFEELNKDYKWNFITTDADLLINLSSLFSCNYARPLNVIFVGGIGLTNAWKNDDMKEIIQQNPNLAPLAWGKDNRLSHNLRAGLRFETNQSKALGLSLELAANSLDDRFNSKTNDQDDWQFTAMIGLNFRFGHKAPKAAPVQPRTREVEETIWEEVPVTKIVKEMRPVTEKKTFTLHKEVFYNIRVSDNVDPSIIQREVADYLKAHPAAKVQIVGYADKGTGNARLNRMYAQRRAETFKKDLMEKYGVAEDRIVTDSKGDTVQPFPDDNDKNRCVIIDAEVVEDVTVQKEFEVEKTVMEKVERKVIRTITE